MYKKTVFVVFLLGKYVDIAWSEMKMAQIVDIHSLGENFNNCINQYNAADGQGARYKCIIRHITGVIDLSVYKTEAIMSI